MQRSVLGFSFVEVLISLLILSIGLLAMAKIQLNILNHDQNAYFYSVASARLQSLAELLQAEPKNINQLMNHWNQLNQQLLPKGRGQIKMASPCEITMNWQEKQKTANLKMNVWC